MFIDVLEDFIKRVVTEGGATISLNGNPVPKTGYFVSKPF